MGPAVSIICCARNGDRFLDKLLVALIAVATDEHEVVLLDDASTDGTGAAFDHWATLLPRAVVLHTAVSGGVGQAQAQAIAAASGEYLWLIDCDDRFPPDAVQTLLAAARRTAADVVVGRAESVAPDGTVLRMVDATAAPRVMDRDDALGELLSGGIQGYTWTKLFRRSLLDPEYDSDGFAPPLIDTQSDFCMVATAISRSDVITLTDAIVYQYVRHGSSMMDGKSPPLENLVIAHDHLGAIARTVLPDTADRRARLAHFTTWFLAASAIQIPYYVRAGPATKREGRELARRAMRPVRVSDVLRVDRLVGVEAVLLAVSPRLYQFVLEMTHTPTVGRTAISRPER